MNKRMLALAVSAALCSPLPVMAIKYKLSGQVNRAVAYMDDGAATDIVHVDNGSSGTRFRLLGSQDIGSGMKAGFAWEWQIESNPSYAAPMKSSDFGPGSGNQNLRKAEVWFDGHWGKLSIGQGDGAGNGSTETDLSNTWNVTYYNRASFSGGLAWRTSMGADLTTGGGTAVHGATGAANALTGGATFSEFDAFSRYDRVRYDTPAIGPATISASVGQNQRWEIAGRVNTSMAGGQLSGGVFYGRTSGIDGRWGGSVAFLFSQGTNVAFSYAQNEPGKGVTNADSWYLKLGHRWGNNAISVAYGEAQDVVPGYNDHGWEVGFNHNIPKAKIDLYAGYHHNDLSTPTGVPSVQGHDDFEVGTKVKFD